MQKTKIEWVKNPDGSQGYSWNSIQGLCPVECWYCYGKRYYGRFWHKHGYPVRFDENIYKKIYKKHRKRKGIFVCSVFELFHPITDILNPLYPHWTHRERIFQAIKDHPQHRFYILTKFPQNIDREMPDNVWLGVTITKNSELDRWTNLYFHQIATTKFVSFEPLLGQLKSFPSMPDWIIVGRLTGYGHKYDPKLKDIKEIVSNYENTATKIFLKDNLKEIWGDNLIQEFPREQP